jgi:hypothetical protein
MTSDTELKEKLTSRQIFGKYFKTKLIVFLAIFIIVIVGRYYNSHHNIEWYLILGMFSFFMGCALILGLMDYYYYEYMAKRVILRLLNESPLIEFRAIGFISEYNDEYKMYGEINDFKIVLAPLVNSDGNKFLTILVPLKIKEGLEKYFVKFDELFKFSFTGKVLFAEAVIKNYHKDFDFDSLLRSIKETIDRLKEENIEPVEIAEY